MLPDKLVAEIFWIERLEFVRYGRALHEEHATTNLEGICDTRERLFHEFERAANHAIDRDRHAAARDLMTEHVNSLEAHLFDDHVEEVDAVRARFAQRKANGRIYNLERDSRETGTATDVNHAGRPLWHVSIDERAVGIMAFHHRFKSIEASQILVIVVCTEQLMEFPNLLERRFLEFHTVVMQQLVEPSKRGRHALSVKQRKLGARSLHVRNKVLAKRTGATTGFRIF